EVSVGLDDVAHLEADELADAVDELKVLLRRAKVAAAQRVGELSQGPGRIRRPPRPSNRGGVHVAGVNAEVRRRDARLDERHRNSVGLFTGRTTKREDTQRLRAPAEGPRDDQLSERIEMLRLAKEIGLVHRKRRGDDA